MKKTYIILLTLIIVILAGTVIFVYQWNRKPKKVADTKPAYTLTTAALLGEFKADSAASNKKFSGEVLQLSGAPDEVEAGPQSISVVFHGEGMDLQCNFMKDQNKDWREIKAKIPLTFKGRYTGYGVDDIFGLQVQLSECVTVK